MSNVLLIEDNREVAGIIFDYFEGSAVELDYADNGAMGLQLAQRQHFDLMILDVMLPDMDGFNLCRALRKAGNDMPILMLTALDNKTDLLTGFDAGADEYLTKPFDLEILEARIHALLRRNQGQVASTHLQFGSLTIDLQTHTVTRDTRSLALSPIGFQILHLLCMRAPQIVTRQELVQTLWPDELSDNDVLRSHIYQLRTQLDKPFPKPMLITVPKVGYRLQME